MSDGCYFLNIKITIMHKKLYFLPFFGVKKLLMAILPVQKQQHFLHNEYFPYEGGSFFEQKTSKT